MTRSPTFTQYPSKLQADMSLIVVSDVHLGYEESNKDDFDHFLEQILYGTLKTTTGAILPCDHLIILGDLFDFWRKDNSTVIEENKNTLALLKAIHNSKTKLHLVVGNHDSLLKRLNRLKLAYLTFYEGLELTRQDGIVFGLLHGDEFDRFQDPTRSDKMCCIDERTGQILDHLWHLPLVKQVMDGAQAIGVSFSPDGDSTLESTSEKTNSLTTEPIEPLPEIELQQIKQALSCTTEKEYIKELTTPPTRDITKIISTPGVFRFLEQELIFEKIRGATGMGVPDPGRLSGLKDITNIKHRISVPGRAREAAKSHKQVLLFGHTHSPFIDTTGGIIFANSGGWQQFGAFHFVNTFLMIQDMNLRLYSSNTNGQAQELCSKTFKPSEYTTGA